MNVCNSILGNTYLYICHFMNCKSNTIGMLHITWLEEIHYLLLLWQKSLVGSGILWSSGWTIIWSWQFPVSWIMFYIFFELFYKTMLTLSFLTMFKADFTWSQEIDGCIDEEGCLKFVHVMLSSYFPHNIS